MNTLCNEILRTLVNKCCDSSIPTLRVCSKEFKSLTSDRYISIQSKELQSILASKDHCLNAIKDVFTIARANCSWWVGLPTPDPEVDYEVYEYDQEGRQRAMYLYDYIDSKFAFVGNLRTLNRDDYPDYKKWSIQWSMCDYHVWTHNKHTRWGGSMMRILFCL
jgi:hypothetical protein